MAQQTATITLSVFVIDEWVNISTYLIAGSIQAEWGMYSGEALDRIAQTGQLGFQLNNADMRFSPANDAGMSGFKKGAKVKLEFVYDSVTHRRFYGTVDDIEIQAGRYRDRRVGVSVLDWMESAATQPIINPGILTDKTGEEIITEVVALSPIPPLATSYDTGINTFPTVFDTVTSKTKAYEEFGKVAFSEMGYLYLRKDRDNGETLTFEGNHFRNGLRTLTEVPKLVADSGFLLKEDGDALLKEDGDNLLLDETQMISFENTHVNAEVSYGDQLNNYLTVNAYPRKIDSAPQILFRLNEPVVIGSGKTVIIKGTYADPSGGLPISGQDMIDPVITTDYLLNTLSDGSGSNISSDAVIVTDYGTDGFTHRVTNNNINNGYITLFNIRGYGIYLYNPISHVSKDDVSIEEFTTKTETLNQKYQSTLTNGSIEADKIIDLEKNPRTTLNKISMCANTSPELMQAFLYFDVGDLVHISEAQSAMDGWFYIQGVEFRVAPGGVILFSWILRQAWILDAGLSQMAIDFAGGSSGDAFNFGFLPELTNMTLRSFSVWIYANDAPVAANDDILGIFSDENGILISLTTDRRIQYYSKNTVNLGVWQTPANSVPLTTLCHVVVTMDLTDVVNNNPIIYIDNVEQVLTETGSPSGARKYEDGCELIIGNSKTTTLDYNRAFDGKIKDVRIYKDHILTEDEVGIIYNGGIPDKTTVTDNLAFRAFCARTTDYNNRYLNQTLDENMKMLDDIYGYVGTPHGTPVARAFT
jgi:hypothetical protein